MPPPVGNALETARLLTVEGSFGEGAGDDGAWELQRGLLMAEYGEGERGMDILLNNLIAVRRPRYAFLHRVGRQNEGLRWRGGWRDLGGEMIGCMVELLGRRR